VRGRRQPRLGHRRSVPLESRAGGAPLRARPDARGHLRHAAGPRLARRPGGRIGAVLPDPHDGRALRLAGGRRTRRGGRRPRSRRHAPPRGEPPRLRRRAAAHAAASARAGRRHRAGAR
jgi:hypothetical protein